MHELDLDDLSQLTPARVLRGVALLEERLCAPGSTSGIVAERARLGVAALSRDGYQGEGGDFVRQRLTFLLGFCRDLSAPEREASRLRYGGVGHHSTYERCIRIGDLQDGSGEEVVDVRPLDEQGQALGPEWVRVRGLRATLPTYEQVAHEMAERGHRNGDGQPMSPGAVERLLRHAAEKVSWAIKARLALSMLEERAT